MNLRAGLAMIFSALRSPLGRLAALSAAVGVFGFALMGETRARQVVDDLVFLKDLQGKPVQEVAHCFCGL